MEKTEVLENISERTGGDIYLGVVGPVRTGKSTFIRRFMELLVLPNIEEFHDREIARDELPQSGTGKTVMTTEPKFIPANAVNLHVCDGIDMRVRMVDCVGYVVPGALGFIENDAPRMVHSPWSEQDIPFEEAAEIGTRKVIKDHSTVGLLVTTDGSITELEREAYAEVEAEVVAELKELKKPFVIVLNSLDPFGTETRALAERLQSEYDVAVVPVDAMNMTTDDVMRILQKSLYEFPVSEVEIHLPDWINELEENHTFRRELEESCGEIIGSIERIRDLDRAVALLEALETADSAHLVKMDLSTGISSLNLIPKPEHYFRILSEYAGETVEGDHTIMRLMRIFSESHREWNKIRYAMEEVKAKGYGIVTPQVEEMELEEPELIKENGRFGVKLKASAPSYHIIQAGISTEITPLVGTEKQCEELVRYIQEEFEDDPQKMWETNIFGKSLNTLVGEGIQSKLCTMPENARSKLQITLERMINDGGGGIICIIL